MISMINNDPELGSESDFSTNFAMVDQSDVVVRADSENKVESRVSDYEKEEARVLGESDSMELDWKKAARASVSQPNGESTVPDFDSAYSMVDEGADLRRSEAFGSEASKALSYGFEPGDMVWGKVKSHPWWPGHIFSEAFAAGSVRRTKRAGHLLVAFFGDSSYGWFDPAELIPFGPNFTEKSRQTSSRSFVKAVEEAMDEASRRGGLGLTCRCRNAFNFRPTSVRGYFGVDVAGYEPGGVYSVMQIKNAREAFQPAEALLFVQQLALSPRSFDRRSINCIQNKARMFAFRKAVYEEFDETYAQAFGMTPVRPSEDSTGPAPIKAPLSGPMVTAEVLGEMKSSRKMSKVKDQSKKNKYLLKRRDRLNDISSDHVAQGSTVTATPLVFKEDATITPEEYVFQKRAPGGITNTPDSVKSGTETNSAGALVTSDLSRQEAESADGKLVVLTEKSQLEQHRENGGTASSIENDFSLVPKIDPSGYEAGTPELVSNYLVSPSDAEASEELGSGSLATPGVASGEDMRNFTPKRPKGLKRSDDPTKAGRKRGLSGNQEEVSVKRPKKVKELKAPMVGRKGSGLKNSKVQQELKSPMVGRKGSGLKNSKVQQEQREMNMSVPVGNVKHDLSKELVIQQEQRVTSSSEPGGVTQDRPLHEAEPVDRELAAPTEKLQLEPERKSEEASSSIPSDSAVPIDELGDDEIKIPELISDLLSLALDPFHGIEQKRPEIVQQAILRFRALVYQKSLVPASPSEAEAHDELSVSKSPTGRISSGEDMDYFPSKHPKAVTRSDDPTKAGRKRSVSGRQEEMSAKRIKKVTELKSTIAEKKGISLKNQEIQQKQKEPEMSAPAGTVRPNSVKRLEQPVKVVSQPAVLVMKFPQRTSLPSIPELKAKFARFGPLDHSLLRVFWKTFTCKVVFREKVHAQAAYNYALRNKSLFGHVNVFYQVRDLPPPEVPGSSSSQFQGDQRPMLIGQRAPQPAGQLKSCLKKPSGDEAAGVPKESPRVKFMLGGEETSKGEQSMVSISKDFNKNGNGGADVVGRVSSSSLAMDVNSKNLQKVIPPSPPVILPFPPARNMDMHESRGGVDHFVRPPHPPQPPPPTRNMDFVRPSYPHTQPPPQPPLPTQPRPPHIQPVEPPTNYNNYNRMNSSAVGPSSSNSNKNNVDISHQMLTLMIRCNDIVSDVKHVLGYVPYRPL